MEIENGANARQVKIVGGNLIINEVSIPVITAELTCTPNFRNLDSQNTYSQTSAAAFREATQAMAQLGHAIGEAGTIWMRSLAMAFTPAISKLIGKALEVNGGVLYLADQKGQVHLGGYTEDIDWLHGLPALRYGADAVTPVLAASAGKAGYPLALRSFFFSRDAALSKNSRWQMYDEMPDDISYLKAQCQNA